MSPPRASFDADRVRPAAADPAGAMAYALRGEAEAKSGDMTGAAADFDKALSMATEPGDVETIKEIRTSVGVGA